MTPRHMPHLLLQQIELVKDEVSSQLSTTNWRNYSVLDINVLQETIFIKADYIIAYRLQFSSISSVAVSEMADRRYNKILHWASRMYRVLTFQPHTTSFEGDSISSTASIGICIHFIIWGPYVTCRAIGYSSWVSNHNIPSTAYLEYSLF